jgi:rod shape determining protein RodA
MLLYVLLIARCALIAVRASSVFGRLLAGTLTLMFFTYVFVNIGMVTGMLPVVGVPLPFISFGGTALMTLFIAVGILMSIATHRKLVGS